MKHITTILSVIFIFTAIQVSFAQKIGVKRTIEGRLRPALQETRVQNDYSNLDFDANGYVEVPSLNLTEGLFTLEDPVSGFGMCHCYCDSLWDAWPRDPDPEPEPDSAFSYLGLMDSDGGGLRKTSNGNALAQSGDNFFAMFSRGDGSGRTIDFALRNLFNDTIYFKMDGVIFMGLYDPDKDGADDVLLHDPKTRTTYIVGNLEKGNAPVRNTGSRAVGHSYKIAQLQLTMKYQSPPNVLAGYEPRLFRKSTDIDFEDDGYLDIVSFVLDENDEPIGLRVADILAGSPKWEVTFPGVYIDDIIIGFHGFFQLDGLGGKEAVFGERTIITLDGTAHTVADDFQLLDVFDADNDGLDDLIGFNKPDSSLQVWGYESNTTTTDIDPIKLTFRLLQNYPNPFNPNTTINFALESPAFVELKIYDVLGKEVRTLVNEPKNAGEYTMAWDGKNEAGQPVASGQYFYQLKAGDAVQTRSMLLLK